jgi:hypothetical protein
MPFDQFVPRPLTATSVNAYAPTTSGVYGISNSREWIYIGETDNIRGALLAAMQELETSLMRLQPVGFIFELCDRAGRPTRQDRLVLEYEPTYNRRCLDIRRCGARHRQELDEISKRSAQCDLF